MNSAISLLRRNRFIWLLATLLLLLVVSPLAAHFGVGDILFQLMLSLVLLASIFSITDHNVLQLAGTLMAAAAFIASVIFAYQATPGIGAVSAVLGFAWFGYTAGIILVHVMSTGRVTLNELAAATCTYLMLGLAGAYIFQLLVLLIPGALAPVADGVAAFDGTDLATFIYFSFTTLTTVGFGDIIPVAPIARAFANLEAVAGQIFLTVLIARLVGMHISQHR